MAAVILPYTTLALALAVASPTGSAAERQGGNNGNNNARFLGMDRNHDGVITRDEWQGSDQSFRVHDWNGDGVLSGDELAPGARKPGRAASKDDYNGPDTYRFSDWTESGFRSLDRNRDGRLSRDEWYYDSETFTRMDLNRDGFVSLREFLGTADDDREDGFDNLDVNRDGRVSWNEWHGSRQAFDALDRNRDGLLTRAEMVGSQSTQPRDTFATLDVNRDGRVSRSEWPWSQGSFAQTDRNGDGVITRAEFVDSTPAPGSQQSGAYRSGYDRGQAEGRQAGREDKTLRNQWDLEGQRELEQADSGFTSQVGARSDYQAGYRAGFRQAYGEGFGPNVSPPDMHSAAYRAGEARGQLEGREAGRQDKTRRNQWNLEGQRELEQADSGYTQDVGSRSDYQAGYRAAFRRAYAEGFGPR